jgi:hypothetical protein
LVIQGAHEESASFYINKVKVKENWRTMTITIKLWHIITQD